MESFHFELTLKNNYHSLASSLSNVSSSFIFLPTLPIFFFLCFSFLFLLLVSAFSFLVILCSFWLYFRSLLSTADGPLSAFSRKDFLILAPLSDFFFSVISIWFSISIGYWRFSFFDCSICYHIRNCTFFFVFNFLLFNFIYKNTIKSIKIQPRNNSQYNPDNYDSRPRILEKQIKQKTKRNLVL